MLPMLSVPGVPGVMYMYTSRQTVGWTLHLVENIPFLMRCSFCAGEKGKKPGKEKGKGKGKGKGKKKSDSSLPTIIPVSPNWGFGHWDTF